MKQHAPGRLAVEVPPPFFLSFPQRTCCSKHPLCTSREDDPCCASAQVLIWLGHGFHRAVKRIETLRLAPLREC
jgi:hypothetical protein